MIHPEQVVGRGTKAVRSNRLVRVPLGYGQLLPVHHEAGKKEEEAARLDGAGSDVAVGATGLGDNQPINTSHMGRWNGFHTAVLQNPAKAGLRLSAF